MDQLLRGLDRLVGRSRHHLVGADAVADHVQHVADQDRLQHRLEELGVHLEALLLAGGLLEAALLLEEQNAEALEARVAERLAVLGDVGAEAAGAAGAGRHEDVVLDDLLDRHLLVVAEPGEVLDQVADGEVGRVALTAVAELLAEGQRRVVGHVDRLDLVADAAERALQEQVVRHGQARDQQRRVRALAAGEGGRVVVAPVLLAGFQAERGHLFDLELLQLGFDVDVDVRLGAENGESLAGVGLGVVDGFHCDSSVRLDARHNFLIVDELLDAHANQAGV